MKKISIFALVLALLGVLSACNRSNTDPQDTTGMTMPTIITTTPTTQNTVPSTSFYPDDDGIIGETQDTTDATQEPRHRGRMHLR